MYHLNSESLESASLLFTLFTWLLPQVFNELPPAPHQVHHRIPGTTRSQPFHNVRKIFVLYVLIFADGLEVVGRTTGNVVWSWDLSPNWINGHGFFMVTHIVHEVSFSTLVHSEVEKKLLIVLKFNSFFTFICWLFFLCQVDIS